MRFVTVWARVLNLLLFVVSVEENKIHFGSNDFFRWRQTKKALILHLIIIMVQ